MRKKRESYPDVLEIEYRLADLPSSQHRAGLAGLVLMTSWIKEEYVSRGICDVEIGVSSVVFYVDQLGLSELFNGLYAASREEQSRPRPMRSLRTREILPPLREEMRVVSDPVTGLSVRTKVFVYETIVPQGAFLAELDPSGDEENGLWIRLWREVVWTILRAVPATRRPFEARANDEPVTDSLAVWSDLCRGWEHAIQLSGTSYLGAQSLSAERIPFMDLARFRFLLNFWPLVAQMYVPAVHDAADDIDFRGFVIAIPDVRDLVRFKEHFSGMLLARGVALYRPRQYRPEEAVIGMIEEAGLDLLWRLQRQLNGATTPVLAEKVLDGVDLFHLERQGNTVQAINVCRIESDTALLDRYSRLRGRFDNQLFHRQQISNLLSRSRVWYAGFGQLLTARPLSRTISSRSFCRDAAMMLRRSATADVEGWEPEIYQVIAEYLNSRSDHATIAGGSGEPKAGPDHRRRVTIARETFLALRARRGQDFIDHFVAVILAKESGGKTPSSPETVRLTKERPDEVRTVALLSLAAMAGDDSK